ncbi:unnamed protein product [Blepharisma stoltei]|uniref:Receptor ligand binding region domain-containing protein n=1 Tax=Blepharisma stoltei TaxID=1481888 RepID=A0AAU9I9W6_9CILI|nr:unnamed protein product [Blepharisma stoltei]
MAIGYIYALRSLNYSIPNVSPYAISSLSQNKSSFPEFMTVTKDERFNTGVILNLAGVFGWKHFIIIYDEDNLGTYNYFVEKIAKNNMKIANSPDLRTMDMFYTKDEYPKWKNWFAKIISLKVRLFVIFLTPPFWFYIVESFYDAGLRRGDALFLSNARLAYSIVWETDLVQQRKIIELLYGTVITAQGEWIGEYGQKIKNGFIKEYGNETDFRCLAFDATILLLNGIEFTIKQGQNVNDHQVMNENLRKQKFLGCSGSISIEPEGNQRSIPTIVIFNLKWNEKEQFMYEELVGQYDASSSQLITFYSEIIWYDNTTIAPSDLVTYENDCPFPARNISHSERGAGILYAITISFIFITIIESFYLWKIFWKDIVIEKLTTPIHSHFEDYIVMGIIVIDLFQFISQGPDISGLFPWLSWLSNYSVIHFDSNVSGDAYWDYLYLALIISCYCVASAFLLAFKTFKILNYARDLSMIMLPIIGNMMFVPMISIILSIFECDKGIGPNVSDSFIKHDCATYCWGDKYLIWGVFSIISLIAYIPLSLYFRIYYENTNDYINIKAKPLFTIEKTIIQLLIVVLTKTSKPYDESLHGLFCIIILVLILFLCFKQSPYNYHRVNLWLTISYIAILWNYILSSLYWLARFDSPILWLMLQFLVWCILVAVGITIQCKFFPSLLIADKVVDITMFFKFSMGNQISAMELAKLKGKIIENKDKVPNFGNLSNSSQDHIFNNNY